MVWDYYMLAQWWCGLTMCWTNGGSGLLCADPVTMGLLYVGPMVVWAYYMLAHWWMGLLCVGPILVWLSVCWPNDGMGLLCAGPMVAWAYYMLAQLWYGLTIMLAQYWFGLVYAGPVVVWTYYVLAQYWLGLVYAARPLRYELSICWHNAPQEFFIIINFFLMLWDWFWGVLVCVLKGN